MRRLWTWLLVLGVLPAAAFAGSAPQSIYVNPGSVSFTNPPQINATAFLNLGTFTVQSALPYDFQNTLYFTNRGDMLGAPGFRFDYTDDAGIRRPAASFVNEAPASVTTAGLGYFGYSNIFFQSMTRISATNLVSAGYMGVGNTGTLRLEGQNVNLSRGGLEVLTITGSFGDRGADVTDDGIPDEFFPDSAIYDLYWGAGIQQIPIPGPINTANILRFFGADLQAISGQHQVQTALGAPLFTTQIGTFVPGTYFTAFGNTGVVSRTGLVLTNFDGTTSNLTVPTNIFRQAVVVGVSDTNFTVRAKFGSPGPAGLGLGLTAVEIASETTNVVTAQPEQSSLYFVDFLGYDTNTVLVTNVGPWFPTAKPFAYQVLRTLPSFDFIGANGNTPLFNGFLYNGQMSNVFATNIFAGYAAAIDNLEARPPLVPGVSITNTPGRVEIVGDTLDLSKTRIRSMTTVDIKAKHLVGSAGAAIDVENLIYDFGSTNGLLTMQSLAKEDYHAVRGELYAWTGVWSNQYALILSNWFIDANTNYFNPVTNPVDVNLYCLVLVADTLVRTQQVITHTLALNSTNVVIEDPYLVSTKMTIAAEGLTVNGRIALTNSLHDWTYSLTPGLRFLTNNGTIRPWNVGYFGADYPDGQQLERFINRGTLEGQAHEIACDYYEDSGTILTANDLRLFANTAILNGAFHSIDGAAQYFGRDFKLQNLRLVASRGFSINATNSFADSGPAANNSIELTDGFHLLSKPVYGDLLGSAFVTTAPRFASVAHTWAAEDRGVAATGFKDNVALGRLTLECLPGGELRFGPPTDGLGYPLPGSYGLYVDYLEFSTNLVGGGLSVAEDPESYIVIEPGLTVYFGTSNLGNEGIDGRFNGQLRWVQDFAGPASGVDVALRDGRTIRVNVGLVDSQEIDSDGDGLVNGFDIYPFDDLLITDFQILGVDPYQTSLSWRAAAETAYAVAYTTNLVQPKWQVFAAATNTAPSIQILTVTDSVAAGQQPPGGSQRYYRVSYEP